METNDTQTHTHTHTQIGNTQGKRLPDICRYRAVVSSAETVPHSEVLFGFQLLNLYSLTHATRLLAVPTLNVRKELALACRNTKETPMQGVVLNASSVLTAPETELVSATSAQTLAQELVDRERRATL